MSEVTGGTVYAVIQWNRDEGTSLWSIHATEQGAIEEPALNEHAPGLAWERFKPVVAGQSPILTASADDVDWTIEPYEVQP